MKKILLLVAAVIMTAFLAAGCADDSKKSTEVVDNSIEGLYYVNSVSSAGYTIPQDNVTVRINSQDYQNIFAVIDGINFTPDIPENEMSFIMYGETRDALNIRYENGKYILPIVVNIDGQTNELNIEMTKLASYPANTGIGNLRNTFKISANNGNSVSANNGIINFNTAVETDSTASDFDFVIFNASQLREGLYVSSFVTPIDSVSYTYDAKENNTYQYTVNINNASDADAVYLLTATEKNPGDEPNNAAITLIKQTKSAASSN